MELRYFPESEWWVQWTYLVARVRIVIMVCSFFNPTPWIDNALVALLLGLEPDRQCGQLLVQAQAPARLLGGRQAETAVHRNVALVRGHQLVEILEDLKAVAPPKRGLLLGLLPRFLVAGNLEASGGLAERQEPDCRCCAKQEHNGRGAARVTAGCSATLEEDRIRSGVADRG